VPPSQRFEFGFEPRYRRPARLFGITPRTSWIDVGDGTLFARFGRWRVRTPLDNIANVSITGPYAFVKTAGPARLGVTDRGLTFATNSQRGVCLEFREPVSGIDPWGLLRHPNLTLTAADCSALAAALRA
jgi:hypothetical protein